MEKKVFWTSKFTNCFTT